MSHLCPVRTATPQDVAAFTSRPDVYYGVQIEAPDAAACDAPYLFAVDSF